MSETKACFKPCIKKGRHPGHIRIALYENEELVDAFSQQGAEEIVAGAFHGARIAGTDFCRLIEEIHETPYLRGYKSITHVDLFAELHRPQPLLHCMQKMAQQIAKSNLPEVAFAV